MILAKDYQWLLTSQKKSKKTLCASYKSQYYHQNIVATKLNQSLIKSTSN